MFSVVKYSWFHQIGFERYGKMPNDDMNNISCLLQIIETMNFSSVEPVVCSQLQSVSHQIAKLFRGM
jgi:hypothetical protein